MKGKKKVCSLSDLCSFCSRRETVMQGYIKCTKLQLLVVPPESFSPGYSFSSPFYSYESHEDLTVLHGLFIILPLFVGDPGELVGNRSSSYCITRWCPLLGHLLGMVGTVRSTLLSTLLAVPTSMCMTFRSSAPLLFLCSFFILRIIWCFPCSLFL